MLKSSAPRPGSLVPRRDSTLHWIRTQTQTQTPTAALALGWVVSLAWLLLMLHGAVGLGGPSLDSFFNVGLYNALMVVAAALCLLRAVSDRRDRAAWALLGSGMLAWILSDVYWTLVLSDDPTPPFPSPADALHLSLYPTAIAAVILLVRRRVTLLDRSRWLDGLIAGLAVGAVAAAVAFDSVVSTSDSGSGALAITLAYPLADLFLLGCVVAVFGLLGWRPGRTWLLLGAGLALNAVADVIYLLQTAHGTYVEGGLVDCFWPAAALLIGWAAWQGSPRTPARAYESGRRVVLIPTACGFLAVAVIGVVDTTGGGHAALILALATLFFVTLRMALAFIENQRLLGESRQEALTDALTGLKNRRSLIAELEDELVAATPSDPRILVVFDLDGFKNYNDSFGHPAGDQLLARLGRRLEAAVQPEARAYRLGGDEFCVLGRSGAAGAGVTVAAAQRALSERGEGFDVTSSYGVVALPGEATTVAGALQLADRRMYGQKGGRRASAGHQSRDVLMSTLREREPELHAHLFGVGELAFAVARRLGMAGEPLDETVRAAELHDVGKVAIPDAILRKPGPLNAEEWAFMRRHTIIGERILESALALKPVARLVRSSHERWDGLGYPDALRGEEIPLGSRIVAVCDAYDAMLGERPYRPPLRPEQALVELRSCAGHQFDPGVVEAFCAIIEESGAPEPSLREPLRRG